MVRVRGKSGSILQALLCFLLFVFGFFMDLDGQGSEFSGLYNPDKENISRQDTAKESRKRNAMLSATPDTNFTYEKYAAFLNKVSDTSKYLVLPINEFRKTTRSNKVVIGLRHDVDLDLNKAYDFSKTESNLGFRSTYYILHTASYYLVNPSNMAVHSATILPTLQSMQNDRHLEIGWHNDLVTLQAVYNIDPVIFLNNELSWLRANGVNIYGTASHGSPYCYSYLYLNYYFFEECTYPAVGQFVNNISLPIGGKNVPMKKGKLRDFNLEYEAYFLNNNKYFSDASITNGIRWNIGMLDISQLNPGDRVIILLHPVHWHKASMDALIESFSIPGQISCSINYDNSTVSVVMPDGTNRSSLTSTFSLSPGAYAKVSGRMQVSEGSLNNYNSPLTFVVYAENRDIKRYWSIRVQYENVTYSELDTTEAPLLVYPNPSNGKFNMKFSSITTLYSTIDIYNMSGKKVYTELINKTGNFTVTVDLTHLGAGIYFVRYSDSEKPVKLIINKR